MKAIESGEDKLQCKVERNEFVSSAKKKAIRKFW